MRIAAVGLTALLCACASHGDEEIQLCEIDVSVVHRPHLIQSTHRVEGDTSYFMCTLSTNDATLGDANLRELLEPECREFIRDAMSAATACSGVTFNPRFGAVELRPVEGTDVNGPFFALGGTAKRTTPQQVIQADAFRTTPPKAQDP